MNLYNEYYTLTIPFYTIPKMLTYQINIYCYADYENDDFSLEYNYLNYNYLKEYPNDYKILGKEIVFNNDNTYYTYYNSWGVRYRIEDFVSRIMLKIPIEIEKIKNKYMLSKEFHKNNYDLIKKILRKNVAIIIGIGNIKNDLYL